LPIFIKPRLMAFAISTARMLRLSSPDIARLRPPACVKQDRYPVRWSISISSDAIGANGSIPASSSFTAVASAGKSSADSGGITRLPYSSRRDCVPAASSIPAVIAGERRRCGGSNAAAGPRNRLTVSPTAHVRVTARSV